MSQVQAGVPAERVPSEQRLRMYQAASTRGTAYALHRWHVTCVDQSLAGHVGTSDARVYQQLRAAQEEERQRERAEAATVARAGERAGIRMFLRPGAQRSFCVGPPFYSGE